MLINLILSIYRYGVLKHYYKNPWSSRQTKGDQIAFTCVGFFLFAAWKDYQSLTVLSFLPINNWDDYSFIFRHFDAYIVYAVSGIALCIYTMYQLPGAFVSNHGNWLKIDLHSSTSLTILIILVPVIIEFQGLWF